LEIGSGKYRRRRDQETETKCPKLQFIFSQAQPIHLTQDSITLIFPQLKKQPTHQSTYVSHMFHCQPGDTQQQQEALHCTLHTQKIFSLFYSFPSYLWNTLLRGGEGKGCLEEPISPNRWSRRVRETVS